MDCRHGVYPASECVHCAAASGDYWARECLRLEKMGVNEYKRGVEAAAVQVRRLVRSRDEERAGRQDAERKLTEAYGRLSEATARAVEKVKGKGDCGCKEK